MYDFTNDTCYLVYDTNPFGGGINFYYPHILGDTMAINNKYIFDIPNSKITSLNSFFDLDVETCFPLTDDYWYINVWYYSNIIYSPLYDTILKINNLLPSETHFYNNSLEVTEENIYFSNKTEEYGSELWFLPISTIDSLFQASLLNTSGINNPSQNNDYKIYPNPFSDFINIESYQNEISEITIYNLLGIPVYYNTFTKNKTVLNLKNLSKGSYILRIVTKNKQYNTYTILKI